MSNTSSTQLNHQWSSFEREMMALALRLAEKGQYTARPNPMVGSVLVKDGKIVGQGWHQKSGQMHAEINALEQAGESAKGATCFVTLEPCAHHGKTGPCAEALVKAGVSKVVAAMLDPNPQVAGKGFNILTRAGIQVESGLLEPQAQRLNKAFVSAQTRGRPWVTCKLAMSLDGRTALANGASKWITGEAARADVQKLRARQDAIITGIGTLSADNPSLTVRGEDSLPNLDDWFERAKKLGFSQPARVLLDREGKAELSAKFFNPTSHVLWMNNVNQVIRDSHSQAIPQHVTLLPQKESLKELLTELSRYEFSAVLLESGHRLAGSFLQAGLIDELVVYMAPKLMGNRGQGLFDIEVQNMADALELKLTDTRKLGSDIRFTYEMNN